MKPAQYRHARDALGWSHIRLASVIGRTERMSYRYANGKTVIPDLVGKMVRRLVQDRLTMSSRKFNELVEHL